jgi:hypothetical protein
MSVGGHRLAGAVRAMVELGVPDLLDPQPRDADDLAAALGVDPWLLARLLRMLASRGVLLVDEQSRYADTEFSRELMTGHGWRDMILGWATLPSLFAAWARLADGVRDGRSPFALTHGHGLHAHLGEDERERRAYGPAMASTLEGFEAFADAADLSGVDTLVSVGGGSGAELVPVLRRHDRLAAVLTDFPDSLEGAEETLASYGVSDRVAIEPGDARLAVPGGDAYLLSTVLRCLDDADVVAVLDAIRSAAVGDARLYVVEMPLPDGPPGHPAATADMTAWVAYGGADRTVDGWRALHARAGWQLLDVRPLNMGYSLLTSRGAGRPSRGGGAERWRATRRARSRRTKFRVNRPS